MATAIQSDEEFHTKTDDKHLETFTLIWLDADVNIKETQDIEQKLRSIINHLKKFQDVKQCQQYIKQRSKNDRLLIIVSDRLAPVIIPTIHRFRHVISIYVFCKGKKTNEEWTSKFAKVKTVIDEPEELLARITADYKIQKKVEEPLSINIYNIGKSISKVNGQFIFSQVLTDCLLRLKSTETDKNELIDHCKNQYEGNYTEINNLRGFRNNYLPDKALWWYTRESFFYKTLNGALRTQNIHMIFLFREFISDIRDQLQYDQAKSPLRVYRSQLMSSDELDSLKQHIGQFISVNSFFSTSNQRATALFLLGDMNSPIDLERVLFEIDADPITVTTKPFADISKYSEFIDESEVLFMIGSIFRLNQINRIDQIWIIEMKLCSDDEHDLKEVLIHMKQQIEIGEKNLQTLGKLLWEMGELELAEKYFIRLLKQLTANDPLHISLYEDLGKLASQRRDYDMSMRWRQKFVVFKQKNQLTINPNMDKTSNCTELDDWNSNEECLTKETSGVNNNFTKITQHTIVSDPDATEIDAVNWYETGMLDVRPDIMKIVNNHEHPILHYKWNAENWLEQMRKTEELDRHSKKYDLNRHLLRVTVMLNTIATVRRKKYIVNNEEVILKSERMRTIGYYHKAKLSYGKNISETELKTSYTSTIVKVVNEDCLVLYEKLVSEGHRPLILNMANATSPGGGYRKGDGAQEGDFFRRSDYYQSLDVEVADKDRSEQFYCTSKCDLKELAGYADLYPIDEFGAIYTSGITVFRQTEEKGYAYMKKPLYDVCAIAVAAYRNPQLNSKNMLENKFAINTHKKIENMFAIAHHHKHNYLVLSAFGCGVLKNPAEHIALLFKSIIYQFAGYFKTIYFAIVDDQNTENRINPKGNLKSFQDVLDGLVVHSPKTILINGVSGPNRILNKSSDGQVTLSDVCISCRPICPHGAKCHNLKNLQHINNYLHPPICLLEDGKFSCEQMNDEVHVFTFMHVVKHQSGDEGNSTAHLGEFDYLEFCKDRFHCTNISKEHLSSYRHLPICRDGFNCLEYLKNKPDHCNFFRHCRSICIYDNYCVNFHNREHIRNTIHSFHEPCPFTPYNCTLYIEFIQSGRIREISQEIEQHCFTYSHVCPHGRQCTITDEMHMETSIHIARKLCPDMDKCSKVIEENHLESFSHPNIRDIRLFCKFPGYECQQRSDNSHLRRYRHSRNHNYVSVAPFGGYNIPIDFVRNQNHSIKTVNNYIETSHWRKAKISEEILDWIRALQLVHRCSKHIFESILIHDHVMSRHYMNTLRKPRFVEKAVQQHRRVRSVLMRRNNLQVTQNVNELIKLLVRAEFSKTGTDTVPLLDADHDYNVNIIETKLKLVLDDHDIQIVRKLALVIAQASIKLHADPMGIGFSVDQKLETDKHVFCILGPHLGHYYGDIVITFKQEIMFHPDANFSSQAGTSFFSGRVYVRRPWLKDPCAEDQRIEHFHNSKLHCSVPGYEYAAAAELIAVTGKDKQTLDVNLHDVLQRWMTVDSHDVFEAHLPQLIPLDYIENVYMPKNIFESLTPQAQQSAKTIFKNSLIITNHLVDLSLSLPGSTFQIDRTRQSYQKFVVDQICQKIEQNMNAPSLPRGVVITIPGTKFEYQIVLPLTISQSYELYCLNKTPAPKEPEFTYIYWQAMTGDMMLTISNEIIDPSKDQPDLRCLICYVAEKPAAVGEDYHEAYSYLNDSHPFQHDTNVHTAQLKAKSNVFYRGCNTDDFFTFCLKLSYKTGEVTLSHAGPNSIYNHEKINYVFSKLDIDLLEINYIHVSAGNQDVPIRNLTINHDLVLELHPSFDREFKMDTSGLLRKHRRSVDYKPRASYHADAYNEDVAPKPLRRPPVVSQPTFQVSQQLQAKKPSFFKRLQDAIRWSSTDVKPRVEGEDEM